MRILTRYVLSEFLKVFLTTLIVFTMVIMVSIVIQEALQQGVGPAQSIRLIVYVMPQALQFAVPGATLFAACAVYGRLSASNEVVAIKSLGISPMVLLWPTFVLGVLLSLAAVWINDLAVTWGRDGVRRVIVGSVEEIMYGMLRTHRSYNTKQMTISVKTVEDRMLIKPTLTVKSSGDKPQITITADKADLRSDSVDGTLTIRFHNASIDLGEREGGIIWPGVYEHVVNLSDISNKDDRSNRPSNCPLSKIPEEIARQRKILDELGQRQAAMATYQMMTGRLQELTGDTWERLDDQIDDNREKLHRLRTEPHRRWASGASCLCFLVVGAPMAIRLRHGEVMRVFGICFIPIIFIYYPFLMGSLNWAKSGAWPPESLWLGNVVLLVGGIWLLRKVIRY